jgi:hypothetical protein
MNVNIYQIFYDEVTKASLDPGFIPLNNIDPKVKGWYEFWPILNFLNNQKLDEGGWYGFLSPKFESKIGLCSKDIVEMLEQNNSRADVLLLSPEWDQIAYFINVFEQGELFHPGLMSLSQNFVDSAGIELKLDSVVMDASNSVFSNYIIAKKDYWERWKECANLLFDYANQRSQWDNKVGGVFYSAYPMKAFIQERLASIVLTKTAFPTINVDQSEWGPINTFLFEDNQETRKLLTECNKLKSKYRQTGDGIYLSEYWGVRSRVNIKNIPFNQS